MTSIDDYTNINLLKESNYDWSRLESILDVCEKKKIQTALIRSDYNLRLYWPILTVTAILREYRIINDTKKSSQIYFTACTESILSRFLQFIQRFG